MRTQLAYGSTKTFWVRFGAPSRLAGDTPAARPAIRWARMAMRERDSSRNHDTYIVEGEARRQRTPRVSIGYRTGKTTCYWQREFAAARRGRENNTFVERRARDYASATPWPGHRLRPCVHETPNDSRLVHWEDPRAGDAARTLRVSACAVPRVRLAATSSRPPGLSL